jgi:indole-3-glycerol phosphate synthase
MKTILDHIIATKQQEVNLLRQHNSIASFIEQPLFSQATRSLKLQLLQQEFGIIAEIKRKSPSGGSIAPHLDPKELALEYEANGAIAISVLTDKDYFGGSIHDLQHVRSVSNLPLLRKEFIIDELQLFESKAAGADAVLLIAAVLEKQQAHHLTIVAQSLGLEVVFEIHTLHELEKLNDEIDIIAVNNRDLAAQQTSLEHSFTLAPYLPAFAPAITASGIKTIAELDALKTAGYKGALIGESILREQHLAQLTFNV